MRNIHVLFCALGMISLAARAEALTLYASTAAGAAGELYILDAATGAVVQDIGALNDAASVNYGMTGLAFHPVSGVLYGSTANNVAATAAQLVTINPTTAQVTVIGAFNAGNPGKAATMADLAFDPVSGILYGVGSVGGPHLYSINTSTGQATLIGSTGLTSTTGGGLAVSSAEVFYGTPTASRFGTYNSTTGAFTNIVDPVEPVGGGYGALDYDGNVLYGLNVGAGAPPPTHLVTISPSGTVTDIGVSVTSLDAVAFQPGTNSLPGDYNENTIVDAADYVVWRDNLGSGTSLPNDNTAGVGPDDYTRWRAHFGEMAGSGAGVSAAVPEPATALLLIAGILAICTFRRVAVS